MTRIVFGAAVSALVIALIPTVPAYSGEGYGSAPAPQTVPQGSSHASSSTPLKVRPEIAKPLQEALKLNGEKNFAGALAKIREADAIADKTPQEDYIIAKFMGQVALSLNDHATATAAFNRALATNMAPADEKASVLYVAMVLNAEAKNYAQAVAYGETLVAMGPLDEKSAVALAQSYYNKGDYPKALSVAQEALARGVTDPRNKAALLEVQTRGQAQRGDASAAIASLEAQCAESCDGKSWGQLVGITMSKIGSRLTNHQALNLLRLRMLAGGMDAEDYLTMATLALQFGLPAEAQSALQKGIAAGAITRGGRTADLLARANTQAGPDARSLPAFEREAAASASGEKDVKLGESYFSHGQLAQAETALRRGLGKGGVRDRADAEVTLGVVLVAAGKKGDAIAAFKNAEASSAQAPVAHVWMIFASRKS